MRKSTVAKPNYSFSTNSYPRVGRKKFVDGTVPAGTLKSPYYWWFMFLRLNKDYEKTVKDKGIGKFSALYKDFGDVFSVDFKTWWKDHKNLFAEPPTKFKMAIATSSSELAPFNSDEVINLVVPLTWSQRSLKKKFTSLVLGRLEKGKVGVSVEKSQAEYKLSGKWHIDAMKAAYKVYTIKVNSAGEEKLPWADIAILAKLDIAKELKLGQKTVMTSDQRRIATSATMRHYERALQFIKSAGTKSFPYSK